METSTLNGDYINEWLTVPETMKKLKISSRTTLYKYLYKFNVRMTKPTKRVYIWKEDIDKLLMENSFTLSI